MKQTLVIFSVLVASLFGWADFENYDEIVDKLSNYDNTPTPRKASPRTGSFRSFAKAHVGLGVAQTFYDVDAVALDSRMQNQGGLLISVGVDVLSARWGVEGSYSNFGTTDKDDSQIKLREFALKGLYKPSITGNWSMRLGVGVSSRFLEVTNPSTDESYRTPSGLFVLGVDSYINSFISVGADLNFKTAMIDETIDNNSIDLAFRVDTHF